MLFEIYRYPEYFPDQWGDTLMMLIPKVLSKNKFRPLALTSCVSKLMEKMLLFRLSHHFESRILIRETQSGFRKGRSCSSSLALLVTKIYNCFSLTESMCELLMDIKSAFDNVIPSKLQEI